MAEMELSGTPSSCYRNRGRSPRMRPSPASACRASDGWRPARRSKRRISSCRGLPSQRRDTRWFRPWTRWGWTTGRRDSIYIRSNRDAAARHTIRQIAGIAIGRRLWREVRLVAQLETCAHDGISHPLRRYLEVALRRDDARREDVAETLLDNDMIKIGLALVQKRHRIAAVIDHGGQSVTCVPALDPVVLKGTAVERLFVVRCHKRARHVTDLAPSAIGTAPALVRVEKSFS